MNSLASQGSQSWLSWFLRGLLVVLFLILFAKLFETQVLKGNYYRLLSEENRIRHIPIPAPRGKILARGGEELATNVEIKERIKFRDNGGYEITSDLTGATPEEIITDYRRIYPLGAAFAHASGYLAKAGDTEIGKVNPDCPQKGVVLPTTMLGKTGLEQEYQCQLMGVDGEELVEVNTSGKKVRTLGRREPVPGRDLKTNIDYNLQSEVASQMYGKKGAAVVTDVEGRILAFFSEPSFDPNLLITREDKAKISQLLEDPNLPFFDRAISGTYHPGSVFKPAVALSALQEGVIDKNFLYTDTGVITVNGFSYSNWYLTEYGRTEGQINLTRAIARSTDTFFYKIGEMVGPNNIAKWADLFGLNKSTGVDLPGETKGLIPTTDWKKQVIKESWFLGDTYHMAIGQGYVAVTPLELNTYIAAIAKDGKLCQPRFNQDSPEVCKDLNISQNNLDLVKEGMKEACSQGGTAFTFFDFAAKYGGTEVACKTGTAEVGTDGTPHAWFTFFAPEQNPDIVATVLIEKGGQGSTVAGPIARSIADYYFQALKQ